MRTDPSYLFLTSSTSAREKNLKVTKSKEVTRWRQLWSIQTIVFFTMAFIVASTSLSVWLPMFIASLHSLREGSERNRELLSTIVIDYTRTVMSEAPLAADVMWDTIYFNNNLTDIRFETDWRKAAHGVVSVFTGIASSIFGSVTGRVSALLPTSPGKPPIAHVWNSNNASMSVFNIDGTSCDTTSYISHVPNIISFNSTWYRAALKNYTTAWTQVFVSITIPPRLIIGIGRPVFHRSDSYYGSQQHKPNAALLGVVAATIYLEKISSFLAQLNIGKQGRVYILERSGYLIASNIGTVTKVVNNVPKRKKGIEHEDLIIRETIQQIEKIYGSLQAALPSSVILRLSNRFKAIVEITNYKDDYGLDWLLIAVISYKELYGKIESSSIITGVVSVISVSVSLLVAVTLGVIIARPLGLLSKELYRIADMEFDQSDTQSLSTLYEFTRMEVALSRMKEGLASFRKYVPSDVVANILKGRQSVLLGVESKLLSIMFARTDVIEHTSDKVLSSVALVTIMQEFFTCANSIIANTEGTIDKYVGECVMSFWGSPNTVEDQEYKAVLAAYELKQAISRLNESWAMKGYPEICIRIGVNTCRCLVGNVGAPTRMNYTVLGDGVNIAARLENLNTIYRSKILIGEMTYFSSKTQMDFACRWVDYVALKGKDTPINVYEVLCKFPEATANEVQSISTQLAIRDQLIHGDSAKAKELCEESKIYSSKIVLSRLINTNSVFARLY